MGKANLYVAYASAAEYLSLLSTLEDYLKEEKADETLIWIDLFSRELVNEPNYNREWYASTFPEGLAKVGRCVLMHDNYQTKEVNLDPLQRTWVCYELQTCSELGIPFDIAMSPMEKVRFREECVSASPRLMRFAPKIDVLNSDASSSSDYKGIIEYLESRFCLQEVDSLIRNLLRTWLVRNIVEALQDYALSREVSNEIFDILQCARKSRDKGRFDLALVLLESCLAFAQAETKVDGNSTRFTPHQVFLTMYDENFSMKDDLPNASMISYFNKILELKSLVFTSNEHGHVSIANTFTHIGRVLGRQGLDKQEQQAVQAYKSAIKMRSDLLGKDHTDVATAHHDLAEVFKARGDRLNAEALERVGDPKKHYDLIRQQTQELGLTSEESTKKTLSL